MTKLSDKELVEFQDSPNDWYVRHARRILQERAASNRLDPGTHRSLADKAFGNGTVPHKLRALWALHVTGGLTDDLVLEALQHQSGFVQAWAVQLALEYSNPRPKIHNALVDLAESTRDRVVRLYVASGAQRRSVAESQPILDGLLSVPLESDQNLSLMMWYALEPLTAAKPEVGLQFAVKSGSSQLLEFTARRIAEIGSPGSLSVVVGGLSGIEEKSQLAMVRGINVAFKGHRQVSMPAEWQKVYPILAASSNGDLRQQALAIAVTFGDSRGVFHIANCPAQ